MEEMSPELVDWAQCELCKKWRRLPPGLNPSTLPDEWVCSMNTWDPFFSSCAVSEEMALNPQEGLNPNINNTVKQITDVQTRVIRGRKKNANTSSSSNTINPQIEGMKSQGLIINHDNFKNAHISTNLFNLFTKYTFDSLKKWSDKIKYFGSTGKGNAEFFDTKRNDLPSCWPTNHDNISDICLVRNKAFEQLEKTKVKINQNYTKTHESVSASNIFQTFPICMFRTRTPNLRSHPLFGRTIISGSDVSIIYERMCLSSVNILPALANDQAIKSPNIGHSNLHYSNAIFNTQRSQHLAQPVSGSISLELIPAVKSDWRLPYLDLSNSLFAEENLYGGSNQPISWDSCCLSYKRLYSFDSFSEIVPSYVQNNFSEGNYKIKHNGLSSIDIRSNVDVLDLLPLLSWINDYSKGIDSEYPKASQCSSVVLQTNKDSKKQSTRNMPRNKTKYFDTDTLENQAKMRRSSRGSHKIQANEKMSLDVADLSDGNKKRVNSELQKINIQFQTQIPVYSDSPEFTGNLNVIKEINEIAIANEETTEKPADTIITDSSQGLGCNRDEIAVNVSNCETELYRTTNNCFDHPDSDVKNNETFVVINSKNELSGDIEELPNIDPGIVANLNSQDILEVTVENETVTADNNADDRNIDNLGIANTEKSESLDEDNTVLINSSIRRRLKKRSRTFEDCTTSLVTKRFTVEDCAGAKTDEENSKSKTKLKDKAHENNEKQANSFDTYISDFNLIPKKKTDGSDIISTGSRKGDPWIPISDSNCKYVHNVYEEPIQNQAYKTKSLNWQGENRRQRVLEQQRRPYYCPGRNNYNQHRYRSTLNYDAHDRNHYVYRSNSSNETRGHNFNDPKKHYFGYAVNQGIQNTSRNEDSYNYRGYYHSRQGNINDSIDNCQNSTIRSNYRSRQNDY